MNRKKILEILGISIILIISTFLRLPQLGYSNYYGDETKVLYVRKDISAYDFLMNQRKGPIQFLAAWGAEKTFGNFAENTTRLPFALAGIASCLVLYLFVAKLFNPLSGFFSALLFSLSGFYVAFARTVQYQSFLLLFGLLSLYFLARYFKEDKYSKILLFLAGIFMGLAFLSHYDAIFFFLPAILILFAKKPRNLRVLYFFAPLMVLVSSFYLPYFFKGYFSEYTTGYISRRLEGATSYKPNNSLYTFWIYHPSYVWLVFGLFSLLALIYKIKKPLFWFLLLWFIVPFITFELIFKNPGTHIHNYFLPMLIIAGIGMSELFIWVKKIPAKIILGISYIVFMLSLFHTSATTFIPRFSSDYPWNSCDLSQKYQLFLYGFPYYRGWDQVSEYAHEVGGFRSFDTNDNTTIGEYYLQGVPVHNIESSQQPQYYIQVFKNQEDRTCNDKGLMSEVTSNYTKIKEIYNGNDVLNVIYKREN